MLNQTHLTNYKPYLKALRDVDRKQLPEACQIIASKYIPYHFDKKACNWDLLEYFYFSEGYPQIEENLLETSEEAEELMRESVFTLQYSLNQALEKLGVEELEADQLTQEAARIVYKKGTSNAILEAISQIEGEIPLWLPLCDGRYKIQESIAQAFGDDLKEILSQTHFHSEHVKAGILIKIGSSDFLKWYEQRDLVAFVRDLGTKPVAIGHTIFQRGGMSKLEMYTLNLSKYAFPDGGYGGILPNPPINSGVPNQFMGTPLKFEFTMFEIQRQRNKNATQEKEIPERQIDGLREVKIEFEEARRAEDPEWESEYYNEKREDQESKQREMIQEWKSSRLENRFFRAMDRKRINWIQELANRRSFG